MKDETKTLKESNAKLVFECLTWKDEVEDLKERVERLRDVSEDRGKELKDLRNTIEGLVGVPLGHWNGIPATGLLSVLMDYIMHSRSK